MRVAYRGDIELLDILLGAGAQPDDVNTVREDLIDVQMQTQYYVCSFPAERQECIGFGQGAWPQRVRGSIVYHHGTEEPCTCDCQPALSAIQRLLIETQTVSHNCSHNYSSSSCNREKHVTNFAKPKRNS